jgi:hypothetical protein
MQIQKAVSELNVFYRILAKLSWTHGFMYMKSKVDRLWHGNHTKDDAIRKSDHPTPIVSAMT